MIKKPSITKYKRAFLESQSFIHNLDIRHFPYDVFKLPTSIRENYGYNIIVQPLSSVNSLFKKQNTEGLKITNGICRYRSMLDVYQIIYNDSHTNNRIRFTILHEIAHVILQHVGEDMPELERNKTPDWLYRQYEGEANAFAGNALAPPILVHEILNGDIFSSAKIRRKFQVSSEAIREFREPDYRAWLKNDPHIIETKILKKCLPRIHPRYCSICKMNVSASYDTKYCRICGNEKLKWIWEDAHMLYSKIELDDKSKARECPRCKNSSIKEGEFCIVCGLHIVNRCTENGDYFENCGALADGDARYCHLCGAETSFYRNDILNKWTEESETDGAENSNIQYTEVIDPDELPF